MPITVVSFCTYPSRDLMGERHGFSDATWSAKKFIDAIKGKQINGHGYVPVPIGGIPRRLDNATRANAHAWFGEMVAAAWRPAWNGAILVPIPGHEDCEADEVRNGRAGSLAAEISARVPDLMIEPLVWFDTPQDSARAGGVRFADEVYPHLVAAAPESLANNARPLVLVDDVRTSGGHIRAAAARIFEQFEIDVACAVVVARTVGVQEAAPFSISDGELPEYHPPPANDLF